MNALYRNVEDFVGDPKEPDYSALIMRGEHCVRAFSDVTVVSSEDAILTDVTGEVRGFVKLDVLREMGARA